MKKTLYVIYCIAFFLIISLPLLGMPFAEQSSSEKRELSAVPSLRQEDGSWNDRFFADTDTYLSEHFAFRSQLVTALSTVKDKVFQTSAEETIIIGRDGWLFFSKTLDDYTGRQRLTDSDIGRIAKTADLINEYVTSTGAKLQFFIAPNKNTLYAQQMPYYYRRGTSATNLQRLNTALADRAYYCNVLALLQKESRQTYHQLDSHWNNLGAAIGFDAVMDAFGLSHTDYLSLPYQLKNTHAGDLDRMLYPTGTRLDEQIVFAHTPTYEYISRFRTEEDITIKTACAGKTGSLTVYRDSFCNALLPMLADEFAKAEFSRIFPYRLNLVEKNQSDAVVIELVERNLPNLLLSAPVMPAPKREIKSLKSCAATVVGTRTTGGMLQIYGTLPDSYHGDILVQVGDAVYEAFPIYESKLIDGEETVKSGGFSLYVADAPANAEITVVCQK